MNIVEHQHNDEKKINISSHLSLPPRPPPPPPPNPPIQIFGRKQEHSLLDRTNNRLNSNFVCVCEVVLLGKL